MVFKNVDINILNKAISNPEELPSIFYQQSRSILPRSLDEIVDSIVVMILTKCHIDTNDANGTRIRNDMNKLFNVLLKEKRDDDVVKTTMEQLDNSLISNSNKHLMRNKNDEQIFSSYSTQPIFAEINFIGFET